MSLIASNTSYSLNAVGTDLGLNADVRTLRYTGAAGSLVVRTSFTTRGIMNVSGNQLDINSNGGNVKAGTSSAAEMVVNAASGNIRFVGTGSFNGNIIKTGSAELIFGAAANFSGISGITVNEGTFVTNAGTDNQLVGATINSGGTLRWASQQQAPGQCRVHHQRGGHPGSECTNRYHWLHCRCRIDHEHQRRYDDSFGRHTGIFRCDRRGRESRP